MQRCSGGSRERSRDAHLILHIVKHEVDVLNPRCPPPDDTVVEAFDSCLNVVLGAYDGMISPRHAQRPMPDVRRPDDQTITFRSKVSFEVEIVCDSTLGGMLTHRSGICMGIPHEQGRSILVSKRSWRMDAETRSGRDSPQDRFPRLYRISSA
jgi:hypothetical protein